ncbi:MAG TPA: acetamidase/formamidase family protein [Planctomycetota bacterium]|nr:acetamidase/formamidase family protein [Planctomycetota bacterium]
MQKISNEVLYFECGADNPVTHRVKPGETFEVQTQINAGPWIDDLPDEAERQAWRKKLRGGNPSSGCIYVEGAKAGDCLSVEIGQIELDPLGYTSFGGHNAATPGWLNAGAHSKLVEIRDNIIQWSAALKLPARPMLGYVGVAPNRERFHNGWGGYWGGNMDAQEVTSGTTLHLKVHNDGALLHVGDMHAIQGDGEICGAGGIEASGRVRLTCRVISPAPESLCYPRIETATHIGVVGNARPAEDAFRIALGDLLEWLRESYKLPHGEGYLLLGQVLEARVSAFVNPTFSYVAKIAKQYLPKM